MNTRSNAYDCFDQPKHFCRRVPFRAAPARRLDFTRINFGWLGGHAITPDALEYCFSRAAAWDCPVSIHVRAKGLAANPRLDDCLATLRLWEEALVKNRLSQEQKSMLRTLDPACHRYLPCYLQRKMRTEEGVRADASLTPNEQEHLLRLGPEHHLFINEKGNHELVACDEIPRVADGAVKAYRFCRSSRPNDTYVLGMVHRRRHNTQARRASKTIRRDAPVRQGRVNDVGKRPPVGYHRGPRVSCFLEHGFPRSRTRDAIDSNDSWTPRSPPGIRGRIGRSSRGTLGP